MSWEYGQQIWTRLLPAINNEIGVAGLMGNLLAESGLIPYRYQGDFSTNYENSISYTHDVDTGVISEYDFVHGGPNGGGYGLAQWTYYTRKQALYNLKTLRMVSIGNVDLGVDYLLQELQYNYTGVLDVLKTASTIRQASDKVLHDFENPQDQSTSVQEYRANLGKQIYDKYASTPLPPIKKKKMPVWMMARR